MRSFKKPSRFGGDKDSGRGGERSFKKFSSGRPSGSSRFGGGARSFGTKESKSGNGFKLHEAVCDKCGNKCDLPFEPTSGKPIYCRSCFRETQKSGSQGGNDFRKDKRDRFESNNRFESNKFEKNNFEEVEQSNPSSDALDKINRKLDKIMKALKID